RAGAPVLPAEARAVAQGVRPRKRTRPDGARRHRWSKRGRTPGPSARGRGVGTDRRGGAAGVTDSGGSQHGRVGRSPRPWLGLVGLAAARSGRGGETEGTLRQGPAEVVALDVAARFQLGEGRGPPQLSRKVGSAHAEKQGTSQGRPEETPDAEQNPPPQV